jgi:tRNA-dihydrouridine synthase B
LQLFTTNTKGIKNFIKKYDSEVTLWDFNLGCPAKNAKKHGFGSFLHKDLESIIKILKTIKESTKKPVTIKIRKSDYTLEIIKQTEKYCDAISIHPRTQKQGYSGKPDLKFAKQIKETTKLPVIYSGNVNEKNAKQFLKIFDAVMIGRNAIGNPNIFAKLTNKKKEFNFKDYLKLAEKYKLPYRQIKLQAMNFTKNAKNAKRLRLKIFECKNLKQLKEIIKKFEF